MYFMYQDREELEDDLYREDEGDSERSEDNSELEFRLYSQLHYSSNAGVVEETGHEEGEQDSEHLEKPEQIVNVDREQDETGKSRPLSPDLSKLLQHKKKDKKKDKKPDKQKKGKSNPKVQRSLTSLIEEVIVIDSGPDVISISEDDTSDDTADDTAAADDEDGVCALKGRRLRRLQTSTPAPQVESKV
ncbi:zinc finger CCHC domain-containing protein 7-like [Notothenia coriiceps]|uniref:Zinc finger CCHC domain-containing protein 7-like n=1 Tax=Notothenia coriiceps TaxID=8208 RepID=A0A6I9NF85_9TELE|nr:PREDICTED: zinc finger CCHC domain-containing protein 7-like [Notothenia coriiceps]